MEIHPIDSGVIRCICKFEHDDGFTLQCEQCNAWQHGVCVGISTEDEAPEIFLCNRCGKLELDPEKAREKQSLYLKRRNRRRNTQEIKKSRNKDHKDPEIADHPECFYNPTDKCILLSKGSFNQNLPTVDLPEFDISVRRVSSHFYQTAFGVETNVSLKRGQFAAQVTGEVDWISNYTENPLNQYGLLGCPKPAVIFLDDYGFVVDSRRRGNEGAFLQKSANPNCRVMPFNDKSGDLRIVVVAATDISQGSLLTIPWTWDPKHPIHKHSETQQLAGAEASVLQQSLDRLKEFGLQGPIQSFLPPPRDDISFDKGNSKEEARAAARKERMAKRKYKPELGEPRQEFIWSVPVVSPPKEDAPKKRLSLADYKKKRPGAAA